MLVKSVCKDWNKYISKHIFASRISICKDKNHKNCMMSYVETIDNKQIKHGKSIYDKKCKGGRNVLSYYYDNKLHSSYKQYSVVCKTLPQYISSLRNYRHGKKHGCQQNYKRSGISSEQHWVNGKKTREILYMEQFRLFTYIPNVC